MGLFDMFKGSNTPLTPKQVLATSLLFMVAADGEVDEAELGQLMMALRGDRKSLDAAIKYVRNNPLDAFLAEAPQLLDEKQRLNVLVNLCDSLLADGRAERSEQALFGRFLQAFQVSEDQFRPYFNAIVVKNDMSVFG